MPALLNGLVVTGPAPGTGPRRFAVILGAAGLAAAIAMPAAWSLLSQRPVPAARPVHRVLPVDSAPASVTRPAPSTAPVGAPPSPIRETAPPAAIAPVPARPPAIPSRPSRTLEAERRRPPARRDVAADGAARPTASRPDEGYDPGAVIDWLLGDAARRGK
jgi:hypothetical protein